MTITTEVIKAGPFNGNDVTTSFAFRRLPQQNQNVNEHLVAENNRMSMAASK